MPFLSHSARQACSGGGNSRTESPVLFPNPIHINRSLDGSSLQPAFINGVHTRKYSKTLQYYCSITVLRNIITVTNALLQL
jgi:hypothetical protein